MADNTSPFKAALVAGVIGYLAGVLLAPSSGKETRDKIKAKASTLAKVTKKEA